jgi:hypothetical protein
MRKVTVLKHVVTNHHDYKDVVARASSKPEDWAQGCENMALQQENEDH